ncbi:unnamed protein product [Orchesella dallaii]|uniref:Uncharacterized protein n=1 Tax=Orchesella dallaii TaxID=48710 RepID=A0ABP1S8W9_9HEXA
MLEFVNIMKHEEISKKFSYVQSNRTNAAKESYFDALLMSLRVSKRLQDILSNYEDRELVAVSLDRRKHKTRMPLTSDLRVKSGS